MKNLINYYYNLILKEFKRIEDRFLFEINNSKYEFIPFETNVKDFQKIYAILINNNKYCHEVIVNRENSVITFYESKPYILLKKHFCIDSKITFQDVLDYDTVVYENKALDWKNLWKNKMDYYEYQISQLGCKYKILSESFSYYSGLSENAINLLNFIDKNEIKLYICHRRINYSDNIDSLFDPLNVVIDNRTRDIGEFLKSGYINGTIKIEEVFKWLNIVNLDYNESLLLIARLLYPSYYFDLYDKIIQEKVSQNKIQNYIKKNAYYETFLKMIYKYLKQKYNIPEIEWLEI
ncbi:MAG: hypothetical protein IJY25_05395 [Bacilli bacterium]|nr:hypothetical protein [Bacilli bacterium]